MQTRTLYALFAAALLVPLGTAIAQEPTDAAIAPAARPSMTYKIAISPAEQWAAPGATATYRVVIEARNETHVTLAVRAPDLVDATLSATKVVAAPGAPGHVALSVVSREDASAQKLPIVIVATSDSGETHEARATLILREKPSETTRPAEPKPYAHHRADELEKRFELLILRAERYLARLEAAENARPTPKPMPVPTPPPIPDVKLRLSDANITLGNDGRRVALLIENGAHEARVPLTLRYDDGSGWKVELEKDGVKLRPHERTYVWISFHPSQPGSVTYAVSLGDSSAAAAAVQGVAHFPGPSIA